MTQEVLIMHSITTGGVYTIRLVIKNKNQLDQVKKALEPLGYSFRFPER